MGVSSWLDGTGGQKKRVVAVMMKEWKKREMHQGAVKLERSHPSVGEPFCGCYKLRTAASSLLMGQKGGAG